MSLQDLHVIRTPIVQHGTVARRVQRRGAPLVVQVDHANFRIIAVDPPNILMEENYITYINCSHVHLISLDVACTATVLRQKTHCREVMQFSISSRQHAMHFIHFFFR